MHIELHLSGTPSLFFTAGNLPTQVAYGLKTDQVIDSFVVALLRSPRVLLAGSYYFESHATRRLVELFPRLWHMDAGHSVFFRSSAYPTFADHGSGKILKSPSTFSPYSNPGVVTHHGRNLDGLGIAAIREDIDISQSITIAWQTSCLSDDPDSIGTHLEKLCGTRAPMAIAACVDLARDRKYDFIWQSIEPTILANPDLAQASDWLRRKLADLYTAIMSLTLGATETSPSLNSDFRMVSTHSVGNLGVFADVIRACAIEPAHIRDESLLLKLLRLEELELLRRVDDIVVRSALEASVPAIDYWRAMRTAEQRGIKKGLRHSQLRGVLRDALTAFNVVPSEGFIKSIMKLEKVYEGKFLQELRVRFEEIISGGMLVDQPVRKARPSLSRDKLLFAAASPPMRGSRVLAVDEEQRSIIEAIDAQQDRGNLVLIPLPAAHFGDLRSALLKHRPRFLHFSGHGSPAGSLFLAGSEGSVELRASELAELLRLTHWPECLFLNACYSAAAVLELGSNIDYSVVMTDRVDDPLARAFSTKFYEAVAVGMSPKPAFELALLGMKVDRLNIPFETPSLYIKGKLHSNSSAQ